MGVFAEERIPKGSLIWSRGVEKKYTADQVRKLLKEKTKEDAHFFLKRAWVMEADPTHLTTTSHLGRYMNHSCNPNSCYQSKSQPCVALRGIDEGEEITCNYGFFATPDWYLQLCFEYDVIPTDEVARRYFN